MDGSFQILDLLCKTILRARASNATLLSSALLQRKEYYVSSFLRHPEHYSAFHTVHRMNKISSAPDKKIFLRVPWMHSKEKRNNSLSTTLKVMAPGRIQRQNYWSTYVCYNMLSWIITVLPISKNSLFLLDMNSDESMTLCWFALFSCGSVYRSTRSSHLTLFDLMSQHSVLNSFLGCRFYFMCEEGTVMIWFAYGLHTSATGPYNFWRRNYCRSLLFLLALKMTFAYVTLDHHLSKRNSTQSRLTLFVYSRYVVLRFLQLRELEWKSKRLSPYFELKLSSIQEFLLCKLSACLSTQTVENKESSCSVLELYWSEYVLRLSLSLLWNSVLYRPS